ncbi:MAG: hypothetical protein ACRCUS_01525, partial [Anaerovoracaceae bacterium]
EDIIDDKGYISREDAIKIIVDSKTQYPSACNAVETLLVHENIAEFFLPFLLEISKNVNKDDRLLLMKIYYYSQQKEFHDAVIDAPAFTVLGDTRARKIIDCPPATEEDFRTEHSDYILNVKVVSSLDEAIIHINEYGSHHTDCILTEDNRAAKEFMTRVDSAGVYHNCSTRFADGYRYGFGAELGISTGKLHARGPVGLEGLLSYKYRLVGKGQIVAEYANGKKSFDFIDINK